MEFLPFLKLIRLSQSIVLWQGRDGIQKIALFGKRPSPYYWKNSSNKQREMTVHHYFKTWSVNQENVVKIIKRCDQTGSHEDRHRKGRPRVTFAAEDTFMTALHTLVKRWPLWFNKCYFIVLMYSLLFYNVENSKK